MAKLITDPNFIPLFIPDEDLVHLPPVRIFGAEHDVLKNDAQIFYGMVLWLNLFQQNVNQML